ncbi:MAG TPA: WD40 repeat domain-containing protein [Candidatus Babeliales bacterium]|nr:WD40 repeat domain-containing protein [Candidatus Babeliales bacterium]
MKYIFFFLLMINAQLICMDVLDLLRKRHDDIYTIAKTTQDLTSCYKNYLCYKHCIAQFLPSELCKYIDKLSALINKKEIANSFIKKIAVEANPDAYYQPSLAISNNGHYYTHNIVLGFADPASKLMDINDNNTIKKFYPWGHSDKNIHFSPHSNYCVIREGKETSLYNLITKESYVLFKKESNYSDIHTINISNDSKHILLEELKNGNSSRVTYTLCTLDAQEIPQVKHLHLGTKLDGLSAEEKESIADLMGSRFAIFHPNSKQIIHNRFADQLELYDIDSGENKIFKPCSNKKFFITELSPTDDKKKIIAQIIAQEKFHLLFDIENPENITSQLLPEQAHNVNTICIPHKNLCTHSLLNTFPLQLINQQGKVVATHSIPSASITALTTDITGNYLAVGYSDGTIMIWDVANITKYPSEKTFMKSTGAITSLTFSDNQLLLSQSKSGEFWQTTEPTTTPGTAISWDIHGNEIINFGDNIVTSAMSKNGKTILVVKAKLKWFENGVLSSWHRYLTLTTYHNENQTDNHISKYEYTLSRLHELT